MPQRRDIFQQFFDMQTSKNGPNPSSFKHFDLEMCFSLQRRANFFFLIRIFKRGPDLRCFTHFAFQMCFAPQWRAIFRRRNFQVCSRNDLPSKCVSRHSGMEFFDAATSKSGPKLSDCMHFYLQYASRPAACHFSYLP